MKTVLLTILAAGIVLGQQSADVKKPAPSQTKELTRAQFEELLAKPDKVLLVDLRRPDEVKDVGGFPAYFSIQIGDLEKNLDWIPRNRTIVTVSNHATRSGQAADILKKHGFKVAGTVGAQTYESQGGKLTKIVPPVRPARGNAEVTEKK
jgi:rhodanese-related sulfurtransferase